MPPAMGQPINVVEKPSSTPGLARFEINRSLTGMGHERYASVEDILDDRPVDELARRLFASGGVTQVQANGSVIIVHLADGWTGAQLLDVIRGLYIYYPPSGNGEAAGTAAAAEPEAAEPAASEPPASESEAGEPAVSESDTDAATAPESVTDRETAVEASQAPEAAAEPVPAGVAEEDPQE
jgi:hypothetical protein